MKLNTNLILIGIVLAVTGTIYAFSGYGHTHKYESQYNLTMDETNLEDRDISFFNVALVCGLAPNTGCGSRSKPVLNSFENSPNVKEAWLNREGNIIAVVWEKELKNDLKKEIVKAVFYKHKQNLDEVSSNEYQTVFTSFKTDGNWIKGDHIDNLIKEEASNFAKKIMSKIKSETTLNASNEVKIQQRISDTYYDKFLNYYSKEDLDGSNRYKTILKDIITYGETLIGKGNMPSLDTLWESFILFIYKDDFNRLFIA